MEDARFSFQIIVTKTQSIGPFCYSASLAYLYERTESGEHAISGPFGERIGSTEEEARQRLEDDVCTWIAAHSDAGAVEQPIHKQSPPNSNCEISEP
jgi:hypothetical protein